MTNLDAHSQTTTALPADLLNAARSGMRGPIIGPEDPAYDEARILWNAMVDRRPGAIFRCHGAADVIHAVKFARDNNLLIAVRSGGHNIAGNAICEGGVVIDLTQMTFVRVDPNANRVWVGPGATLGAVDRETQAFGLAIPTGINSTTGIAGLTLGGGFGWLTRKLGMTVDNLVSADVVTADGHLVRASSEENSDLFWALRGGGGNFGVVTAFEFALHPIGPEVMAGLIVHPFDNAPDLLRSYREAVDNAPDELTCWVVMRQAPPLPFLPEEWHGREVLVFAICYCGDLADAEAAIAPLRSIGRPIADVVGPTKFADWQTAFDPLLAPGARNYWKSHDFAELSDGAIATIVDAVHKLPGSECEIFIGHVGGAMGRTQPDTTAYPFRDAHFIMNVHTRWRESRQDQGCISWARGLFAAAAPFATGSAYVNFMPDDEQDRIEKVYGPSYRRLAAIKQRYDPHNLFRMNQNIKPASS
jgi:FAD/FMN-containing dehydrogenase